MLWQLVDVKGWIVECVIASNPQGCPQVLINIRRAPNATPEFIDSLCSVGADVGVT